MSNKLFKEGRCADCNKPKDDDAHDVEKPPGLLYRLLHLAWPRWARSQGGRHQYRDRDTIVRARDDMAEMKRWAKRKTKER